MKRNDMTLRSPLLNQRLYHSWLLIGAVIVLVATPIFTWSYFKRPCEISSHSILGSKRHPIGPGINNLEVKITTPRCDSINLPPGNNAVEGTYSGNLDGREIWILVYGSDGKYYPQSSGDPCQGQSVPAADGHWRSNLFLGVKPPERFDIVATTTDSKASQFFKDWLKTSCDKKVFFGISIPELPDGLIEMDAITVETK